MFFFFFYHDQIQKNTNNTIILNICTCIRHTYRLGIWQMQSKSQQELSYCGNQHISAHHKLMDLRETYAILPQNVNTEYKIKRSAACNQSSSGFVLEMKWERQYNQGEGDRAVCLQTIALLEKNLCWSVGI